ncbi:MAG TPA: phosphoribosyltransferase family protein [Nitrososphaeraceae archaeon]|nr:phosphoribosyltransferase family protein [Nitrososphaeraceae archaeon]
MQTVLFRDRTDAARQLAERLYWLKNEIEKSKSSVIIMAIPRGGIIIGNIIAKELRTKLDLVVTRKIGAPFNPELAIGAVMPDGSYFLNDVAEMINISQNYIESQIRKEVKEIERRLIEFRGRKEYDNKLEDKIVVLVDDGIATGATILASTKWIKDKHNCKQLIIAVPLAPREILEDLNRAAGKVIVLYTPEPFGAVGRFYQNFKQVSDDEVKEIMKEYL